VRIQWKRHVFRQAVLNRPADCHSYRTGSKGFSRHRIKQFHRARAESCVLSGVACRGQQTGIHSGSDPSRKSTGKRCYRKPTRRRADAGCTGGGCGATGAARASKTRASTTRTSGTAQCSNCSGNSQETGIRRASATTSRGGGGEKSSKPHKLQQFRLLG